KNKFKEIYFNIKSYPNENYFSYNIVSGSPILFQQIQFTKIIELEERFPSQWSFNEEANPMIQNERLKNLLLRSDSPMMNRGGFLTKTTDFGSGNQINLEDAGYFLDGWGIIEGDLIQLQGQMATA